MTHRKWHWTQRDRQAFIRTLTETGNPAVAAAAIGRSLADVYAMRERWPLLAEEWQKALGVAWEQVENRVLANLLDGAAAEIDPKVALEMLKRRAPAATPRATVTIDALKIARIRNDIRALPQAE